MGRPGHGRHEGLLAQCQAPPLATRYANPALRADPRHACLCDRHERLLAMVLPLPIRRAEAACGSRGRIERLLDLARERGFETSEDAAVRRGHLRNLLPSLGGEVSHLDATPCPDVPAPLAHVRAEPAMAAQRPSSSCVPPRDPMRRAAPFGRRSTSGDRSRSICEVGGPTIATSRLSLNQTGDGGCGDGSEAVMRPPRPTHDGPPRTRSCRSCGLSMSNTDPGASVPIRTTSDRPASTRRPPMSPRSDRRSAKRARE